MTNQNYRRPSLASSYLFGNLLSIFIQCHPLTSLFIDKLCPLFILRDQSFIQGWIVQHPFLLSDNVCHFVTLCSQNFFHFHSRIDIQMIRFDDQRWFCKLMQWWRRRQNPFQRLGNQRDYHILARRQIGGKGPGSYSLNFLQCNENGESILAKATTGLRPKSYQVTPRITRYVWPSSVLAKPSLRLP
jgi:hypothetical protein